MDLSPAVRPASFATQKSMFIHTTSDLTFRKDIDVFQRSLRRFRGSRNEHDPCEILEIEGTVCPDKSTLAILKDERFIRNHPGFERDFEIDSFRTSQDIQCALYQQTL